MAAALAVVLRGDEPLLLEPEPERPARRGEDRGRGDRGGRRDRPDWADRADRGTHGGERWAREDRPGRGAGPKRGRPDVTYATYRIAVGKRQKVEPRQIVGAIANEGGLGRQDFGHIDIRADHSLVELPAQLPPGTWDALRNTRISGQLIELTEVDGGTARSGAGGGAGAGSGGVGAGGGGARRPSAGPAMGPQARNREGNPKKARWKKD